MKIRIITDSAADFSQEELRRCQITRIPMPILCGEETYLDGQTLSLGGFWQKLTSGALVKTSLPSPEAFLAEFQAAKAAGDAVICILISSALSGTLQCAELARTMAEYEHIYIIDALQAAASAAEKLLVLEACRMRDAAQQTPAEIAAHLEAFRSRIRLFACLDTLEYLARGGRLSRTAANVGALAQVKPIITFSESGEVKVFSKAIGRQRAMAAMVKTVLSHDIAADHPVAPIYADCNTNCLAFLEQLQEAGFALQAVSPSPIGATIGTHIGPGAYGIVFVEKEQP